ncbi:GNAT family N-acetyltransferase [Streptomyces sp. WMMC905]|uniref:GNAT family N-acetyltransferase n=1 Tax=Streptomyces sp. WMMC905 TaxID=3404123 RepID=UPI003B960FA4
MRPPTLTTARLVIRTVGPGDADAVFAACQDPDISRWTTVPSPYRREHARDFLERQVPEGWADETAYTFGIFLGDGRLTGLVGLTPHPPGAAEIGFWAVPEHRGRGHVTEAVVAVSHWAFAERGIDRLEWRAEVGNDASLAVARRAGFTLEGTLRSGMANKGTRRDCWVGSLLPGDVDREPATPYRPARPDADPARV